MKQRESPVKNTNSAEQLNSRKVNGVTEESSRKMHDWLVIGVSGVTCSGKTTLAEEIHAKLKGNCTMLNQDNYFLPAGHSKHVWIPELNHFNWELITAMDMPKMYTDMLSIIEGATSEQDKNMHSEENGLPSHERTNARKILIVEGFTIFKYKPISERCNLKYYLTLTKEQCWERRKSRIYNPPDVPRYFDEIVWPEYLKQKAEVMEDADLKDKLKFLDGSRSKDDIFDEVFNEIRMLIE